MIESLHQVQLRACSRRARTLSLFQASKIGASLGPLSEPKNSEYDALYTSLIGNPEAFETRPNID
jgi:hypothetical protein